MWLPTKLAALRKCEEAFGFCECYIADERDKYDSNEKFKRIADKLERSIIRDFELEKSVAYDRGFFDGRLAGYKESSWPGRNR